MPDTVSLSLSLSLVVQLPEAAGGRGAGVAAADGGALLPAGAQPQQCRPTAQAQPLEPQVSAAAPAEDEGECQAPQPVQYPFIPPVREDLKPTQDLVHNVWKVRLGQLD